MINKLKIYKYECLKNVLNKKIYYVNDSLFFCETPCIYKKSLNKMLKKIGLKLNYFLFVYYKNDINSNFLIKTNKILKSPYKSVRVVIDFYQGFLNAKKKYHIISAYEYNQEHNKNFIYIKIVTGSTIYDLNKDFEVKKHAIITKTKDTSLNFFYYKFKKT